MENLEIIKMFSKKYKQLHCINEYKFAFQQFSNGNVQRWSCLKRLCKWYFKMNKNNEIIFTDLNHEHDKDDKDFLNR